MAKFKRRSLVDGIFQVGIILVVIGFAPLCWMANNLLVYIPSITLIFMGIVLICYGLVKHNYLLRHHPEYLMPEDAQINARVANLLTDNISEANKVEIAKVLTKAVTPKEIGE